MKKLLNSSFLLSNCCAKDGPQPNTPVFFVHSVTMENKLFNAGCASSSNSFDNCIASFAPLSSFIKYVKGTKGNTIPVKTKFANDLKNFLNSGIAFCILLVRLLPNQPGVVHLRTTSFMNLNAGSKELNIAATLLNEFATFFNTSMLLKFWYTGTMIPNLTKSTNAEKNSSNSGILALS